MPLRHTGEWKYSSTILDRGTGWRGVVTFTPPPLYPGEIAYGAHWIGGCVGPSASLDAVEKRKMLPLPRIELWPTLFT
jgi:hypothetical protein